MRKLRYFRKLIFLKNKREMPIAKQKKLIKKKRFILKFVSNPIFFFF